MEDENVENEEQAPSADESKTEVSNVELSPIDSNAESKDADRELNLGMILDIPVDIHVELGQTRKSIKEILKLGEGSVIELDRLAGEPADIIVNGKMIGQGDVVIVNENFGIRISKLVDPAERIESL